MGFRIHLPSCRHKQGFCSWVATPGKKSQ